MVTEQDQIKVLDFGLATLAAGGAINSTDETGARAAAIQTGAGTILGTVAYMSPEQAEGHAVDARSDIFSFGAILYEMLSGLRAFRAGSTPATLAAVINLDPEPLAKVARHVPPAVDELVGTCLRKDVGRARPEHLGPQGRARRPARRPRAAARCARAAARVGRLGAPDRARRGRRRRGGRGRGAVAVVARCRPRSRPSPLTALPGSESFPSFSPDGSQVAFTWLREGGTRLPTSTRRRSAPARRCG